MAEFDSEASNTIDYIAITHTNRVQWGQLGKIEIYATDRKGAETLVTTADCGMSNNGTSRIKFEPALTDVAKIRIKGYFEQERLFVPECDSGLRCRDSVLRLQS
ncbi:MAG: hypothetical protein L6V35_07360 [Alistipes putredinis]|nr:MAG: hypothetical protein L6V35_07360 [Alistipes putredinis]